MDNTIVGVLLGISLGCSVSAILIAMSNHFRLYDWINRLIPVVVWYETEEWTRKMNEEVKAEVAKKYKQKELDALDDDDYDEEDDDDEDYDEDYDEFHPDYDGEDEDEEDDDVPGIPRWQQVVKEEESSEKCPT